MPGLKKVEDLLRIRGHEVLSVMEENPLANDSSILNKAAITKRVVVIINKDFGDLVFNAGYDHDGVLLLRLGAMNGYEKVNVMNEILESYSTQIHSKLSVCKSGKLRVKNK